MSTSNHLASSAYDDADGYSSCPSHALGEAAVLELCGEYLLDRVMDVIRMRRLDSQTPNFVATLLVYDLRRLLSWDNIRPETSDWDEFLQIPYEPDTGCYDRWAPGSLQSRPRKTEGPCPILSFPAAASNATGTISINSSRSSIASSLKRRRKSTTDNGLPLAEGSSLIYSVVEESEQSASLVDPYRGLFALPMQSACDTQLKSSRQSLQHKLAEEEQVIESKIAELKGKKWTVDANGTIIEIQAPSEMRNMQLVPSFTIKDGAEFELIGGQESLNDGDGAARIGPAEHLRNHEFTVDCRLLQLPLKDEDDRKVFTRLPYEQPPIVADELEISVASGVTVRQGQAKLTGAPLPSDPDHLSLAEYESIVSGDRSPLLDGQSIDNSSVTTLTSASHLHEGSQYSSLRKRLKPLKPARPFPGPDIDVFADGRPLNMSVSQPLIAKESVDNDENVRLIHAPDWGRIGTVKEPLVGRLCRRRSHRQRQTTRQIESYHGRTARARNAAARPTKKLRGLSVPPPGLSSAALSLLRQRNENLSVSSINSSNSPFTPPRLRRR